MAEGAVGREFFERLQGQIQEEYFEAWPVEGLNVRVVTDGDEYWVVSVWEATDECVTFAYDDPSRAQPFGDDGDWAPPVVCLPYAEVRAVHLAPCEKEGKSGTLDVLIQHELDRWRAEEQNSSRLQAKRGQLLTLLAALLGVGLVWLGNEPLSKLAAGWRIPAMLFGVVAIAMILHSLVLLLHVRLRPEAEVAADEEMGLDEGTLASSRLAWPERLFPGGEAWRALDSYEAKRVRAQLLEEASGALYEANEGATTAIATAQERLFGVAVCLSLLVACYIFGGSA